MLRLLHGSIDLLHNAVQIRLITHALKGILLRHNLAFALGTFRDEAVVLFRTQEATRRQLLKPVETLVDFQRLLLEKLRVIFLEFRDLAQKMPPLFRVQSRAEPSFTTDGLKLAIEPDDGFSLPDELRIR